MADLRNTLREALGHHQAGRLDRATELYNEILAVDPHHAESLHLLGVIAIQSGRPADAIGLIERAVAIRSDQAAWFGNLGTARSALGDLETAIGDYRRALSLDPGYVEGHYNLGHVLSQLGAREEAEASYRNALAANPNHVGSLNNLGTCLRERGHFEEAIELFRQATSAAPGFVEGHYNLGNALRDAEQLDQSVAAFRRALELQPDSAKVRAGFGITLLLSGDLDEAWTHYEARISAEGGAISSDCTPLWDGSSLDGQTIMAFAEQGFGDTLQFVRYTQQLKSLGATVFVECQAPLMEILSTSEYIDGIYRRGEPLPPFDLAVPLLSLPGLLGTRLDNVPCGIPYLIPRQDLMEKWSTALSEIPGLKVGIAWQGATGHLSDSRRSLALSEFAPVAAQPGVTLIALQKGPGVEQLDEVDFEVHRLPDDVDEQNGAFMDTAAVMKCLDLVITSDTSIAHLAGALGVPVWIALCKGPDWRWMLDRSDSPWYPTARLYRQSMPRVWTDVFERMATDVLAIGSVTGPITVEVSAGELIDKITILEIKQQRITDAAKLQNIHQELGVLTESRAESIPGSPELDTLVADLRSVNEALWDIEDEIRECERNQQFDDKFVHLARAVYVTNDRRSDLKRAINDLLGSRLVEEKSYSDYSPERSD